MEDDPVTSEDSLQDPDLNISSDDEGETSGFEISEAETTEISPARVSDRVFCLRQSTHENRVSLPVYI